MTQFSEMLDGMLSKQERLQRISVVSAELRRLEASQLVWELYRDKVLTSFQAKEILIAMGFTVVMDTRDISLVSYK